MKVIDQNAVLLDTSNMTPYQVIERVGRTCYKSEDRITEDSATKFVANLYKDGHHAMLEFGYVYVKITDLDLLNFIIDTSETSYVRYIENYVVGSLRAFYDWLKYLFNGSQKYEATHDFVEECKTELLDFIWGLSELYPEIFHTMYDEFCAEFDENHHYSDYDIKVEDVTNPFKFMSREEFIQSMKNDGFEDDWLSHMIPHIMLFTTDRGCYDTTTKVLTNHGWKYFKDVDINTDLICTLDDSEHVKYVKAIRKIQYNYSGYMHRYKTSQIDLLVTPDHNMWVSKYDIRRRFDDGSRIWEFVKSIDTTNRRYLFNKTSKGLIDSTGIEKLIIPDTTRSRGYYGQKIYKGHTFTGGQINSFLELLGIWLTDGSVSFGTTDENGKKKTGDRITISQRKPYVRDRIVFLSSILGFKATVYKNEIRITSLALFDWLIDNFIIDANVRKTYYLTLPRWMYSMNQCQIKSLFSGIILGDGSQHTMHSPSHKCGFSIYTASKQFAEDMVELAMLGSMHANIKTVKPRIRLFPGANQPTICREQYVVSVIPYRDRHMFVNDRDTKTLEQYDDFVYCLELESDHRLYVLRNGKACWCGNCTHELARHRPCSFAMESTRYCNYGKEKFGGELTFIKPYFNDIMDHVRSVLWVMSMEIAEKSYMKLIASGAKPEAARDVLPHAIKADIWMCATEDEWQHILDLRYHEKTGKAHPKMKELMGIAYPQLVEASEGRIR